MIPAKLGQLGDEGVGASCQMARLEAPPPPFLTWMFGALVPAAPGGAGGKEARVLLPFSGLPHLPASLRGKTEWQIAGMARRKRGQSLDGLLIY